MARLAELVREVAALRGAVEALRRELTEVKPRTRRARRKSPGPMTAEEAIAAVTSGRVAK